MMEDSSVVYAILKSPLNLFGVALCVGLLGTSIYLLKNYLFSGSSSEEEEERSERLPKMKRRDFYLHELIPYNGRDEKRILIAVNFKVFDVTNRGKDFYGPGGPYSCFAGRDASRALANMSLAEDDLPKEFDDLSDLSSGQKEQIKEWEMQFSEKYYQVGRLLKPDEKPTDYSESESSSALGGE